MMGGYALFEASLLGAFGSYTNSSFANYAHFNTPGGWVTWALIGAVIIFSLSYFDVKWSVFAMAPFLVLEVGVLLVLDLVITIHPVYLDGILSNHRLWMAIRGEPVW